MHVSFTHAFFVCSTHPILFHFITLLLLGTDYKLNNIPCPPVISCFLSQHILLSTLFQIVGSLTSTTPPPVGPYLATVGGLRSQSGAPLGGCPHCGADEKELPKLWFKLPCQGLRGAQGELHCGQCLLHTRHPPGVHSQALGNRGSAQVKLCNNGTRWTKMDNKDTPKKYEEVIQGVATFCSE